MPEQNPSRKLSSAKLKAIKPHDLQRPPAPKTQPIPREQEDEPEETQFRRPKPPPVKTGGLSLRYKILASGVAIIFITALLIYLVVSRRTTRILDEEIDAKGLRITEVLASLDASYWTAVLDQKFTSRTDRYNALRNFLYYCASVEIGQRILGDPGYQTYKDKHEDEVRKDPEPVVNLYERLQKERDHLVRGYETKIGRSTVLDQGYQEERLDGLRVDEVSLLDEFFERTVGKETYTYAKGSRRFRELLSKMVIRLDRADPFAVLKGDKGYKEILQASVLDVKTNRSVNLNDREMSVAMRGSRQSEGGVRIADAQEQSTGLPVRSFIKEVEYPGGTLRFTVLLSLADIEAARSALLSSVFLPTLISAVIGIAILVGISFLITTPLQKLVRDINIVSEGDLDHQTEVDTRDEIGLVARTFNRMTQLLKIAHEQEIERKTMEHELNIAHQIQANLLPKKKPMLPGYDIDSFYRPSKEVGGDYFDFLEIDESHLGLVVADVSGKGVPASIVMSMVRTLIRMEAERSRNLSTRDTLIRVNQILAKDIKKGMFVTAMYVILDCRTHELLVSSAGHNPLVVWRAATKQVEWINPNGMALGFSSGDLFARSMKEEKYLLEPGDRIVGYTDGVVEAMNENKEIFGDKRLNALVQKVATRPSNEFVATMAQVLDQYKGSAPQHDDITIVTARRLP